jgi:hypothetical protein
MVDQVKTQHIVTFSITQDEWNYCERNSITPEMLFRKGFTVYHDELRLRKQAEEYHRLESSFTWERE